MAQLWTITDTAGETVLQAVFVTPSTGSHPKDNGWAWNAATQKAWKIDAAPNTALQVWGGAAWADDLAKVKADLIAKVKATNGTLVSGLYTTAFGKQRKYSRKGDEALDYRALPGALGASIQKALTATLNLFLPGYNALTASEQIPKFRFARAQAMLRSQLTGANVTIDTIIAEFEVGIANDNQVAFWEAVEQEACRAIRAATSADAARAAYAAINWNWKGW